MWQIYTEEQTNKTRIRARGPRLKSLGGKLGTKSKENQGNTQESISGRSPKNKRF